MNLRSPAAEVFVPDGTPSEAALARVTHLGIGAHADDLEFMAFHGIIACHRHEEGRTFGGITCTDGAGSARTGPYAGLSDEALRGLRRDEQRQAAMIGNYGAMVQLGYTSAAVADAVNCGLVDDLETLLRATKPDVLYTHNLCDKHDTHVRIAFAAIEAARRIEPEQRPRRMLGCEVWRDLDWLPDDDKVLLDVSGWDDLADALHAAFSSQIAGGKRYDLAVRGRRAAHATFHDPRTEDAASQVTLAMDLTPLLDDPLLPPAAFALSFVDRLREDVAARLLAAAPEKRAPCGP